MFTASLVTIANIGKKPKCPSMEEWIKKIWSACFGITYTKTGMIQKRLAWPLCKDETQTCEAFYIFMTR